MAENYDVDFTALTADTTSTEKNNLKQSEAQCARTESTHKGIN